MSLIGPLLNLLLAGLLLAALWVGWRLHARLNALRASQEGFVQAVRDLDQAAQRAEQGLESLKTATLQTQDELNEKLEEARDLVRRLERGTTTAVPAPEASVRRPPATSFTPTRTTQPDGLYEEPSDLAAALRELRRRRGIG